ncbi:M20 family metallopeptidase [Microlunatus soli]|uniref:Glutamate carboxypeptidase n=1 Tax=Microlunatus soli TaxID=630515 RepID=A0A1H1RI64_9ACTN|nr:M20 family metallopeptidase [Microlunatus soli]SDS35236.1 glutamate carboxypeptidase [Microlunatus soli]
MTELLARAEGRFDELIKDIEALVRLESPSDDLEAVGRSADLVAEIGERYLGSAPERVEVDGRPHLVWRLGDGPRRVIVLAHHDTVWPIGSWGPDPWSFTDGVIRGPGCFDMITGIVQALLGMRLLIEDGVSLDGVTLLVTADEEVGSKTSRSLIESEAAGCRAAFVLEASGPGGALKIERKGTSDYQININGRAAHAGLEPEKGINAGVELAHQLLAINELGDSDLGTTVTPTVLSAGTTTNTVPAKAMIKVDCRVRSAAEQQRVDHDMHALQAVLPGAELIIEGGPNRPPLPASAATALFDRAQQLATDAGLDPLQSMAVGGASDGNFTAGIGVPTLDGLGAVGGGAHADDEHVEADKIPARTALLALLIKDQLVSRGTLDQQ